MKESAKAAETKGAPGTVASTTKPTVPSTTHFALAAAITSGVTGTPFFHLRSVTTALISCSRNRSPYSKTATPALRNASRGL